MFYLFWKLVHVASVVIFLGNITTGVFWASNAHRTRDFSLIAATFEGIIRSDRWFTIPGVVGILVSGFGAAGIGKLPILGTGWILWSLVLFTVSGLAFMIWVAPLQRRIVELARDGNSSGGFRETYERAYRKWGLWGLIALITPIAALVIMVLKPSLPGL